MLEKIKLIEEGTPYSDGRVAAHGSINWRETKLPVVQLYSQKIVGEIFNLRREGNIIYGDSEIDFTPDGPVPFLIHLKGMDVGETFTITEGTLVCVYVS